MGVNNRPWSMQSSTSYLYSSALAMHLEERLIDLRKIRREHDQHGDSASWSHGDVDVIGTTMHHLLPNPCSSLSCP